MLEGERRRPVRILNFLAERTKSKRLRWALRIKKSSANGNTSIDPSQMSTERILDAISDQQMRMRRERE